MLYSLGNTIIRYTTPVASDSSELTAPFTRIMQSTSPSRSNAHRKQSSNSRRLWLMVYRILSLSTLSTTYITSIPSSGYWTLLTTPAGFLPSSTRKRSRSAGGRMNGRLGFDLHISIPRARPLNVWETSGRRVVEIFQQTSKEYQ